MKVIKKTGLQEPFDKQKIFNAVVKTMVGSGSKVDKQLAQIVTEQAYHTIVTTGEGDIIDVNDIHTTVENTLMHLSEFDLAREYITYRDHHKPDIFRPRTAIKPYEYPHLLGYVDAIRSSYWIHTHFNYTSDIQDLKVNLSEADRQIVTRAMLAISQIESAVKTFWGKIGDHIPKPEVSKVGATFSENEVRHEDAYSNLIEIAGLNSEFEKLSDVPAMQGRIRYLDRANQYKNSEDPREFFESIILFSILVENISLFSQFFIIMSYNQHANMLKGMSNAVEATSKEENLHALFGIDLINIIKEENPSWWDENIQYRVDEAVHAAMRAESDIVDWIYEGVDSKIAPKEDVLTYLGYRGNRSLDLLELEEKFEVDSTEPFQWFEDEIEVTKNYDFFNKRATTYSRGTESVSAEDLF